MELNTMVIMSNSKKVFMITRLIVITLLNKKAGMGLLLMFML